MYLYDRKNDTIEIYSMQENINALKAYQTQEMQAIPMAHRVLEIETNTLNVPFSREFPLQKNTEPIDIKNTEIHFTKKKIIGSEYHRLKVANRSLEEQIMDTKVKDYYFGNYNLSQMVRVYKFEQSNQRLSIAFYLLLNGYYDSEKGSGNIRYIRNIINIPESLYLLELLRRGHFSLLDNKDITEQLKLFTISENPIKCYTLKELEELGKYDFDPEAANKALDRVENSRTIFERVRRKK